jgi:hypothetical protein
MFERFDRVPASKLGGVTDRSDPTLSRRCGGGATRPKAGGQGISATAKKLTTLGHPGRRMNFVRTEPSMSRMPSLSGNLLRAGLTGHSPGLRWPDFRRPGHGS